MNLSVADPTMAAAVTTMVAVVVETRVVAAVVTTMAVAETAMVAVVVETTATDQMRVLFQTFDSED